MKINNFATRSILSPAALRRGLTTIAASLILATALAQSNTVTLNFVNADIVEVARAIGVMTGRNLVVDPRVQGTLNMVSDTPVTTTEAYDQFLSAARLQGYTVIESSGIYKLLPEADAKLQTATLVGTNSDNATPAPALRSNQIATQVFPLSYENANNMVTVLRPLLGANSTININPSNNSIIITDYADNLRRAAKLIASQDVAKSTDLEVIPLKHTVASELAPLVSRLMDAGGGASGGANGPLLLTDARSNSLIVRATNPVQLGQIKSLISKLDRNTAAENAGDAVTAGVYIVKLKNGDASKIATTLRSVLPNGITVAGQGASNNAVQVQADAATNSLIITASSSQYQQLRPVIDKLDARPAQVFIESLIAEVNTNKLVDFGIQWQAPLGNKNDSTVGIIGSNFGTGSSNVIQLATGNKQYVIDNPLPQGLNLGLFKNTSEGYVLGALARFLETSGDANILSTPNVLTVDNEESRVVVGQNVPFVTGQYSATGASNGNANPFQTIERRDIGLTLRVKPQIADNGTIRLKIFQENSDIDRSASATFGLVTNKRSIETNVLVDDGSIVVLGGLIKDDYNDAATKVPLLGDLPIIGNLFKTENRIRQKSNLMVFLRPTIIRSEQDSDTLSNKRYDDFRTQQLKSQQSPSLIFPNERVPALPNRNGETAADLNTVQTRAPRRPAPVGNEREPVPAIDSLFRETPPVQNPPPPSAPVAPLNTDTLRRAGSEREPGILEELFRAPRLNE